MMKACINISAAFILLLFVSCDILRQSPFEVVSWSPGMGYKSETQPSEISFMFSHDCNRESVQKAFLFTEDGVSKEGDFFWDGKKLVWNPTSPPQKNKNYKVTISADAENAKGVSLDEQFEAVWTTRPDGARPEIISVTPSNAAQISNRNVHVEILFSVPVKLQTFVDNVSFTPARSGLWTLEASLTRADFQPYEAWAACTEYKISVSNSFESAAGKTIAKEWNSYFYVSGDNTPPVLQSAVALLPDGNPALKPDGREYLLEENMPAADNFVNEDWESEYKIALTFSEPVRINSVQNSFSIEPSVSFTAEADTLFSDTVVLRFSQKLQYGEHYILSLGKNVSDENGNTLETASRWKLFVNGKCSKPPVFKGFAMPQSPVIRDGTSSVNKASPPMVFTAADNLTLPGYNIDSDEYLINEATGTWIVLFFDMAHDANINLFSLMEKFGFSSTNGAVSWTSKTMTQTRNDFVWAETADYFTDADWMQLWNNSFAVEIKGTLRNDPVAQGLVTVSIGSGLLDSLGNETGETQQFILIK
jgi:hypothetical protein